MLLYALLGILNLSQALVPIKVQGNRFVKPGNTTSSSETFYIVGVDYQPGGSSGYDATAGKDVLSDEKTCLRDAYVLQNLGVNTIRVYSVDPWINHDKCMSILNAAGIYVLLDVNTPHWGESLARDKPKESYNSQYLNHVFGVIDAFKDYPNLLGFFSGNEVVNDEKSAKQAPPYLRALTRDMKMYISKHASREIPVGYSAAEAGSLRTSMWAYLTCGKSDFSRADFYGLNSYNWCSGRDDWKSSGYESLKSTFDKSPVPVFLSEYGCNVNSPRTFTEVNDGLYGPLAKVFSGGLVYEYSQEPSQYGLVDIHDDGSVHYLKDYENLKSAYAKIKLDHTPPANQSARELECSAQQITALSPDFNAGFNLPDCPDSDMLSRGGGNRNVGKIVNVQSTEVPYSVYDADNHEVAHPALSINATNLFNGFSAASNSTTGTSPTSAGSAATNSPEPSSPGSATSRSTSKSGDYRTAPSSVLLSLVAMVWALL